MLQWPVVCLLLTEVAGDGQEEETSVVVRSLAKGSGRLPGWSLSVGCYRLSTADGLRIYPRSLRFCPRDSDVLLQFHFYLHWPDALQQCCPLARLSLGKIK